MSSSPEAALSRFVWETRYRDPTAYPAEVDLAHTWKRVARAVSEVERNPSLWNERFLNVLSDFRFLPGGRVLAGAGTQRKVTLSNCFVMGLIDDSIDGIFQALKEGALTIQQGGGVGYDFSTIRPRGTRARTSGATASGPVSFMYVWDAMCGTMQGTGARGGAMMATLRCDHPDIEAFVDTKRAPDVLSHFNLSVQVTEQFMQAVMSDQEWPLMFPDPEGTIERTWSGGLAPVPCRVHRVISARGLWRRLCDAAYDCAEPGVLFVDRINGDNNLSYCEQLTATNPCGEEPLPPYGSCNLGSINLAAFVVDPFTATARLDEERIQDTARLAVRFLDNAVEISTFPLNEQREQARHTRRVGLGLTGLADVLAMLGLRYDSEPARSSAAHVMRIIRDSAYEASVDLARERGAFPAFRAEAYVSRPFIASLPPPLQAEIARHGTRNSHLLAIAPAGSISLLARNVSSGIEPMFGIETLHRVRQADGGHRNFQVTNHAYAEWCARQGGSGAAKPGFFVEADSIAPRDHLLMQAAIAPYVDGAVSKTISLPRDFPMASVPEIFETAHLLGLKGCTVFRTGSRLSTIRRSGNRAALETMAAEYGRTSGRAED